MVKEVPSKVFNAGLDKWILRSIGIIDYNFGDSCSYCHYYEVSNNCQCPLASKDFEGYNYCCNGLYYKWRNAHDARLDKTAMRIADKIVDLIIERCVYEI